MRVLTSSQLQQWTADQRISLKSGRASYAQSDARYIELHVPTEGRVVIAMGYVLLMLGLPDEDETNFAGCLFHFNDCNIWSKMFERTGRVLLDAVRKQAISAAGEAYEAALLLESTELPTAQALLLLPMLFQWDAVVIPASGAHAMTISHDGVIQIVTRSPELFEQTLARLKETTWKVRERISPGDSTDPQ